MISRRTFLQHGATANVKPAAINRLFERWREPESERMQEDLTATRAVMEKYSTILALKAIVARFGADPDWATVRPPLVELSTRQSRSLVAELTSRGFAMPGLVPAL